MDASTRAAVAAIAVALSSGQPVRAIYDYGAGRHVTLSGSASSSRVNAYLHDRSCHLSGSGSGNKWSLYQFGDGHHVELTRKDDSRWSGYDYGSGRHYELMVRGKSVSVYDYATSSSHQYG